MFRIYSIIIILLGISSEVFAQNKVFVTNNLKEKITLFTDRDLYIAGEKIYFSAIVENNTKTQFSNILYLELKDRNNALLVKKKFKIDSGLVNSYVSIPDDIITGNFTIRAYTKFLRNYLPDNFSYNTISIINPQISLPKEAKNKLLIDFFPQGGSFVANAKNNITLKLDRNLSEDLKLLQICDSKNNIIKKCKFFESGLSFFSAFLSDSVTYKLKLTHKNGNVEYFAFPKKEQKNISIITELKSKKLDLNIYFKAERNENDQVFNLEILNSDKKLVFSEHFYPVDNFSKISISNEKLSNGLNIILVKDKNNKINAISLLYFQNVDNERVNLKLKKGIFSPRERINVEIENNNDFIVENISVVKKGSVNNCDEISYKFLYDKRQFAQFLNTNFITNNAKIEQINYLLNIYSDISFLDLLFDEKQEKQFELVYLPENRGVSVSGVLKEKETGNLISNRNIFISTFGNRKQLHVFNTNDEGKFYFSLNEGLNELENIYICTENLEKVDTKIFIDNDFEQKNEDKKSIPFHFSHKQGKLIKQMYINKQITNFSEDKIKEKQIIDKHFLSDTSLFTSTTIVDNYIKLNTLRDVFREIVPLVNVVDSKAEKKLKLYNIVSDTYFDSPLVLLDNIPVFDIAELFKVKASLIERISVVNVKYYIGNYLANGIISIYSKNNNFADFNFPANATFFKYNTLSNNSFLDFKKYETAEDKTDKTPYFRNCIYWNTQKYKENKASKFEFYASDHCGEYQIIYRYLSKKGKIIETSKTINIER